MRSITVWRCDKRDPHLGALVSWHETRRAAERELAFHREERGQEADGWEGVTAVAIPMTKGRLLTWLNNNLASDNG